MTEVDVIILSWNDGELLPTAIGSALASEGDLDLAVTVIDNGSDDEPLLVDDPRVRLHRNLTNRGVAGGRNDGMALTSAPVVCFLDSDAQLAPGSLQVLCDLLLADERTALTVPVFEGQAAEASAGAAPTLAVKLERVRNRRGDYDSIPRAPGESSWDVDFGIGACQVLRRTAFEEVGGLDESLYWTEDVDFCLKLREAGWRVLQTEATRVVHPPRRRFRRPLSRRGLQHAVAVARFLWRHRGYRRASVPVTTGPQPVNRDTC